MHSDLGIRGRMDFSVDQVRKSLADFGGMCAIKLNSRLRLGFSTTISQYLKIAQDGKEIAVLVQPDLKSDTGSIMNDGCGFIAVWLLTLQFR